MTGMIQSAHSSNIFTDLAFPQITTVRLSLRAWLISPVYSCG